MLLSNICESMVEVAIGWEIYERTNSATALGLVGLVEALPVMVLSLIAGHVVDRHSRKNILLLTLLAPMACYLGLAAVSYFQGQVALIFGLLCAAAIAKAFRSPTRSAFVPQIVPLNLLSNAVTWNSSLYQVAAMTGPMIGGFLIAGLKNYGLVYALSAIGNLVFFICVLSIHENPRNTPKEPLTKQSLLAGVDFIRRTPLILSTITLDLFAVLLGGATALLPMFARDILHTSPTGLGWLRAAPALGAFGMALLLAHLPPRISPLKDAGRTLLWSVTGFGIATIIFGLSKSFWLSLAMLFLTGVFDNVSVVVRSTLVSVMTPDKMRGRVAAVNYVFIGASNELGAFESGITAAAFGPIAAVVGGGIGSVLTVLAVMWIWPDLRKLKSLEDATHKG